MTDLEALQLKYDELEAYISIGAMLVYLVLGFIIQALTVLCAAILAYFLYLFIKKYE